MTKVNCQEVVDIFAEAVARAGPTGYVRKTVGAEVLGMTACPCAQEIMKEQVRQELAKAGLSPEAASDLTERSPIATHNQRGRGSISVEVHDRRCVSIDRIIKIIEESMSSKSLWAIKASGRGRGGEEGAQQPKVRGGLRSNYGPEAGGGIFRSS